MKIHTVPEHSIAFMQAVSGGTVRCSGDYLFFTGDNWLIGIGYPVTGSYDDVSFWTALEFVARKNNIEDCWAIAPSMPAQLQPYITEKDVYYILPLNVAVPPCLRREVRRAETCLRIDETTEFSAAHRRLWAEFVQRRPLKAHARELFARTVVMLNAQDTDIRLLNAWDSDGNLAACCVMDYAPDAFCSYIIGAHSRIHYTPHAVDALFAVMLRNARKTGKEYIHLGLGVNEGITRFKKKWGGFPIMPYLEASWHMSELPCRHHSSKKTGGLVREAIDHTLVTLLHNGGASERRKLPEQPEERPYAMLWEVRKDKQISFLGGTAHLFRYSFARSFRKLFRNMRVVLFEGPLDAASLALVAREGARAGTQPSMVNMFNDEEIHRLHDVVNGTQSALARFLNIAWPHPIDVRGILASHRPWAVFFSLYYAYLQRYGWNQSVDMEAWDIAHDMDCQVICMETIEDQLASLESIPLERICYFLRHPETWRWHRRVSMQAYLAGDIEKMQGTGTEFPSRTERVISVRDDVFIAAMLPYFEQGSAVALVGTAHLFRLRGMLQNCGFQLRQVYPTMWHKLRASLRGDA
ncbi:MAG: TraB/GumN family protein [Desulfovibrio sp.]|nr:TraB/GumN family protein [Desulfovibrio sp.]